MPIDQQEPQKPKAPEVFIPDEKEVLKMRAVMTLQEALGKHDNRVQGVCSGIVAMNLHLKRIAAPMGEKIKMRLQINQASNTRSYVDVIEETLQSQEFLDSLPPGSQIVMHQEASELAQRFRQTQYVEAVIIPQKASDGSMYSTRIDVTSQQQVTTKSVTTRNNAGELVSYLTTTKQTVTKEAAQELIHEGLVTPQTADAFVKFLALDPEDLAYLATEYLIEGPDTVLDRAYYLPRDLLIPTDKYADFVGIYSNPDVGISLLTSDLIDACKNGVPDNFALHPLLYVMYHNYPDARNRLKELETTIQVVFGQKELLTETDQLRVANFLFYNANLDYQLVRVSIQEAADFPDTDRIYTPAKIKLPVQNATVRGDHIIGNETDTMSIVKPHVLKDSTSYAIAGFLRDAPIHSSTKSIEGVSLSLNVRELYVAAYAKFATAMVAEFGENQVAAALHLLTLLQVRKFSGLQEVDGKDAILYISEIGKSILKFTEKGEHTEAIKFLESSAELGIAIFAHFYHRSHTQVLIGITNAKIQEAPYPYDYDTLFEIKTGKYAPIIERLEQLYDHYSEWGELMKHPELRQKFSLMIQRLNDLDREKRRLTTTYLITQQQGASGMAYDADERVLPQEAKVQTDVFRRVATRVLEGFSSARQLLTMTATQIQREISKLVQKVFLQESHEFLFQHKTPVTIENVFAFLFKAIEVRSHDTGYQGSRGDEVERKLILEFFLSKDGSATSKFDQMLRDAYIAYKKSQRDETPFRLPGYNGALVTSKSLNALIQKTILASPEWGKALLETNNWSAYDRSNYNAIVLIHMGIIFQEAFAPSDDKHTILRHFYDLAINTSDKIDTGFLEAQRYLVAQRIQNARTPFKKLPRVHVNGHLQSIAVDDYYKRAFEYKTLRANRLAKEKSVTEQVGKSLKTIDALARIEDFFYEPKIIFKFLRGTQLFHNYLTFVDNYRVTSPTKREKVDDLLEAAFSPDLSVEIQDRFIPQEIAGKLPRMRYASISANFLTATDGILAVPPGYKLHGIVLVGNAPQVKLFGQPDGKIFKIDGIYANIGAIVLRRTKEVLKDGTYTVDTESLNRETNSELNSLLTLIESNPSSKFSQELSKVITRFRREVYNSSTMTNRAEAQTLAVKRLLQNLVTLTTTFLVYDLPGFEDLSDESIDQVIMGHEGKAICSVADKLAQRILPVLKIRSIEVISYPRAIIGKSGDYIATAPHVNRLVLLPNGEFVQTDLTPSKLDPNSAVAKAIKSERRRNKEGQLRLDTVAATLVSSGSVEKIAPRLNIGEAILMPAAIAGLGIAKILDILKRDKKPDALRDKETANNKIQPVSEAEIREVLDKAEVAKGNLFNEQATIETTPQKSYASQQMGAVIQLFRSINPYSNVDLNPEGVLNYLIGDSFETVHFPEDEQTEGTPTDDEQTLAALASIKRIRFLTSIHEQAVLRLSEPTLPDSDRQRILTIKLFLDKVLELEH